MSDYNSTTTASSLDNDREPHLKQTVDELRDELGREVNARTQQVRDWANVQADQVRNHVVDKPFQSAGAAFAVGVILGVLLARR